MSNHRPLEQVEIENIESETALNKAKEYDTSQRGIVSTAEAISADSQAVMIRNADFPHGYFEFDSDVRSGSVGGLLSQLRKYSRHKPGSPILIEMNSPGGSIIDGFRLFDELLRLRSEGHHLTIRVRGEAASMGAVLLQAADKRECGPNAFIMIHRAAFGAGGKAYEVEDVAEFVKEKLERRIIEVFAERTHRPSSEFEALFEKRKDLWYTATEALEGNLIDEIV